MNEIYNNILEIINKNRKSFDIVVSADNLNELNITSEEIINFLEYSVKEEYLSDEIKTKVIITNGNVLCTLKIIHDLAFEEGNYILFINEENVSINYFFVDIVNVIYRKLKINVQIKLDLNINYNKYLDKDVTLIGDETFINEAKNDFQNVSTIIV